MSPRTYHFVPGNRPDRFATALNSGAEVVVLDLEDAVAATEKDAARDAVATWAASAPAADRTRAVVRVNDTGSPHVDDDLALLAAVDVAAVMLAKAESAEQVARVRAVAGPLDVLALVETAVGVNRSGEIAEAEGVTRLVFGTLDLALDLDLDIDASPEGLTYAAGQLVVASRVAGLPAPVAGVTPQLGDDDRLRSDLAWSRRHGFGAKLCIHPAQVAAVHAALVPSPAAVEHARRVLAADAASPGAARLDGRMIDRPVVLAAQRLLARAGH